MKRYYSEKDLGLGMLIFFPSTLILISLLFIDLTATAILVLVELFTLWLWFGTYYEFRDSNFVARSGPLRIKIAVKEITEIRKSKSLKSGFALSFNRLEIMYGQKKKSLIISPREKEEFLQDLKMQNPAIEIIL